MGWRRGRLGAGLAAMLLAQMGVGCSGEPSPSEPPAEEQPPGEPPPEEPPPEEPPPGEPPPPEEPPPEEPPPEEPDDCTPEPGPGGGLSCEAIRPGELGPSRSIVLAANAPEADCGPGIGDGAGSLALRNSGPLGTTGWSVVRREGVDTGNVIFGGDVGNALWPQPNGFHNLRTPPSGASVRVYASDGTFVRSHALSGGLDVEGRYIPLDAGADPQGGSLLAKWAPGAGGTEVLTFQFLDVEGLPRTEPRELLSVPRSDDRFVIGGVDTLGHALLVWGEAGAARWVGQWLNRNGEPLTESFTFPAPSSASGGMLAPLAGGGLALRNDGQWTTRFPSGEAGARLAPEWLASHPGSELFLIRGQRANVLVPKPTLVEGSGCQESLLFFASDGTACGELLLPVESSACSLQRKLGIGRDGTVIQMLDRSDNQCSWRWWPELLK